MRKITLFCVVSVITICPVYALNRLGPPISELGRGVSGLGFDFTHDNENLEFSYGGLSITDDAKIDLYLANFGIGLDERNDLYLKFGGNHFEDMGTGFAWSVSGKSTLAANSNLKFGIVTQTTGVYNSESAIIPTPYGVFGIEDNIDAYELQIGIGPCLDKETFSLYAYPLFHMIWGEDDFGIDIEQTSELGACAGIVLKQSQNASFNVEGQFIGDSYAVGAGLMFKFGAKKPTVAQHKVTQADAGLQGKRLKGYRATINPKTGHAIGYPVYEDENHKEMKLKLDEKGEPVKDADGNFIFVPVE